MRRSELERLLERVPMPATPVARLEQVVTPTPLAAELLLTAVRWDGLRHRSVADLGSGTGRLAIGAALLGAHPVVAVEVDPALVDLARAAADRLGVAVDFEVGDVSEFDRSVDLVVMNPPFGAQRAHADRPFWDRAFALAGRGVYAFALAASRSFIARRAVAAAAHVLETRPVPWVLPRTFPHHARRRVEVPVDLWAIRTDETDL